MEIRKCRNSLTHSTIKFRIVAKLLAWVITGDIILDIMNFYITSIEEVRLYTYYDARDARDKARYLLSKEVEPYINIVFTIFSLKIVTPFFRCSRSSA